MYGVFGALAIKRKTQSREDQEMIQSESLETSAEDGRMGGRRPERSTEDERMGGERSMSSSVMTT